MKRADAEAYFGGRRKLAEFLGLSTQAVYAWGEYVPKGRAYELEIRTDGALRAEPDAAEPSGDAA